MTSEILIPAAMLLGGLAAFMALIWSMLAVNARVTATHGYAPFALPNAALLLIAHLLFLSALSDGVRAWTGALVAGDPVATVKTALASLIVVGMLLLLVLRSGMVAGAYATLLMTGLAPVVLFSLLFWQLARGGSAAGDNDHQPH
jgi:hypothetical protein